MGYDLISPVNRRRFIRKDLSEYNKKKIRLIVEANLFLSEREREKERDGKI